jgi:multidrug efflux pump subunit AcrB
VRACCCGRSNSLIRRNDSIEVQRAPLMHPVGAGRVRLRPILKTSLTTVIGMLSLAIGFGEGSKIMRPLGSR